MNKFSLTTFFKNLTQLKEITPYQEAVLTKLISFWGKDGCYPSYETIAAEAGVCVRTVAKVLKEARLRGWLTWTNSRNGRRQSSNHYRFTISRELFLKIKDDLKKQMENFKLYQRFQRMHGTHRSPYLYINKEKFSLFKMAKEVLTGEKFKKSAFQKLSIEDQIRQLQSI